MPGVNHGLIMRADLSSDGVLRGVASTIGDADLMNRVFLPGAYGQSAIRVPLLLNHEQTPLGESILTPTAGGLRHESRIVGDPAQPGTGVPIRALLHSGYPATSIGWYDEESYYGWSQLQHANPELARQLAMVGIAQDENLRYFAKAKVAENSLVSVPANPRALLDAASMLPRDSLDRRQLEAAASLLEMPPQSAASRQFYMGAGAQAAQELQTMHDSTVKLGATCQNAAAFTWTTPKQVWDSGWLNGTTTNASGGFVTNQTNAPERVLVTDEAATTILTETADGKAKYSMPDGSYPITTCADVSDAAKLAHNSKKYSFEQVRRHVMRAKNALNCNDDVIPESWESPGQSEDTENSALPTEGDKPEVQTSELNIGQLEKELRDLIERP